MKFILASHHLSDLMVWHTCSGSRLNEHSHITVDNYKVFIYTLLLPYIC